eukprot:CAMPEP_0113275262 /NCGR_PEP_ID=MMETSP0008_2-20120614/24854_1 /TAXON_ID=97485 /ORGANISM="Prymnesium parvum" /LENGTH=81 /DNA_ID=CAMNT_0000124961 /DNA_START=328 /DNA_END=570 /DNA_ORIENTATION=+ /assembly_acc=CAM_ASM_000153
MTFEHVRALDNGGALPADDIARAFCLLSQKGLVLRSGVPSLAGPGRRSSSSASCDCLAVSADFFASQDVASQACVSCHDVG